MTDPALLESAGRAITAWVATAWWQTSLLVGAALFADLLLARRVSASWRILLYLPALVRVLIPASAAWTVPGWHAASPLFTVSITPGAAAPSTDLAQVALAAPAASLWPIAVLAVYLSGVLVLAGVFVTRRLAVARLVQASTPHPTHPTNPTDPSILIGPDSASPMVVGVFRPRIVIPRWLLAAEGLPLILAHERAHIARRDPLLASFVSVVCVLAWPVLPVWLAGSRIRGLMEQSCDDAAIRSCGQRVAGRDVRSKELLMKYAETLIDTATRVAPQPGALSFGASLRSRVRALRPARRWPKGLQASLALAIPALLLACSSARPEAAAIPASPPAAGQLNPAPSEDTRVVRVQVIAGELPLPGFTGETRRAEVVPASFDTLFGDMLIDSRINTLTTPTLLVNIGQHASVETEIDGRRIAIDLVIHASAPDAARATLSFADGSDYVLPPTELRFIPRHSMVVRIPSGQVGIESRTLVITIDLPGDEASVGC